MIVSKQNLTGRLTNKQLIQGVINKATEIIEIYPETQTKTITPTKQTQTIIPDENVYALSQVTVNPIPNNYIEPQGQKKITENGNYDITNFASANVEIEIGKLTNAEYTEANDDLNDILEGSTPTKIYPPDWSEIGYENTPQDILDGFNIAKEIKDNWDNTTTNMLEMFRGRKDIFIFPMIDTSNVTNMNSVFYSSSINIVPVLETKNVTGLYNTFGYCSQLEPNSLNNIMQMCINATSYTRTKTLKEIGLSSTQATTCQSLSNYQAFLEAGWTTGY